MQLRNRRWHVTDAPFLDVETTPYANGTVNIRLTRVDAQPGDTPAIARQMRTRHVFYEDDIIDDDLVIMRNVRALMNAARLMAAQSKRQCPPVRRAPVIYTVPPSRRQRA